MAGGVITDAFPPKAPRYHAIDGAEWLDNYGPGGYHPVMPGDYVHNKRYRVTHKLGHGSYSTVWLVRDAQAAKYRALKINAARISADVQREIAILRELKLNRIVPEVIDDFEIQGPNGVHTCYTMHLAANSLAEAKQHDAFPIEVARALAAKLASLIKALHSHGFCHGGKLHDLHQSLRW
jgi:serine/threonine protein kinase